MAYLHDNEVISFYGRVSNYTKGYVGLKQNVNKPLQDDYKISFPSKVKLELDLTAETIAIHKHWPEKDSQICNMIYDMYSVDYESRGIMKPYPKFYD